VNMMTGSRVSGATHWPRCCAAPSSPPSLWAAAAILIALLLSQPWAALGLAIGLAIAVLNLRFLDAGVAKLNTEGETSNKVLRRAIGTKSVTRLGVITVVCIGLLLLNGALGIGAVAGLVIFQLLFVVNVGRVIISQGIQ
jgi:hypothetical protein